MRIGEDRRGEERRVWEYLLHGAKPYRCRPRGPGSGWQLAQTSNDPPCPSPTYAYVSIRQHTSEYVSIRQHTSAYVSIRHTHATAEERLLLVHLSNLLSFLSSLFFSLFFPLLESIARHSTKQRPFNIFQDPTLLACHKSSKACQN